MFTQPYIYWRVITLETLYNMLYTLRYRKRKQDGSVPKTDRLTVKQHEKKKKQWRKNSAKYYEKKKNLNAILDLTPPSSNEIESDFQDLTPPASNEIEPDVHAEEVYPSPLQPCGS